jgi:threonine aldolase
MQSDAMMLASLRATRGDDVYEEDESTRILEQRVAEMSGKEAAMFASSGTMTNRTCSS